MVELLESAEVMVVGSPSVFSLFLSFWLTILHSVSSAHLTFRSVNQVLDPI